MRSESKTSLGMGETVPTAFTSGLARSTAVAPLSCALMILDTELQFCSVGRIISTLLEMSVEMAEESQMLSEAESTVRSVGGTLYENGANSACAESKVSERDDGPSG